MPSVAKNRPVFNKEFGQFLAKLREDHRWSRRQAGAMAERRGLPLNYQKLEKLEAGKVKNPAPEVLKSLATLYGENYQELTDRALGRQYGVTLAPGGPVGHGDGFTIVPVMARRIAAGQPILMDNEEPSEFISFKQDFARRYKNPIGFRVGKGQQSMMPTLLPDDLVVVDRDPQRRLHPDPRNIYALNLDNGGTLKRVEVKSGLLIISSDNLNKTEYPTYTEPIAGRSLLDFIIGEVVWFGRYLGTGRGR